MKTSKQISKRLKELTEIDDLEEINVTGNVAGYNTPKAFTGSDDIDSLDDDHIEVLGYKKTSDTKKNNFEEVLLNKIMNNQLNEISYLEYKKDPSSSPKYKVNKSINEINKKLREIEHICNQNVRLKQEANVDNGQYWKSTKLKLNKISERLLRVSKKFRDLSS